MRTLETFHACDPNIELIVVLPVEQRSYWEHLCAEYGFTLPHRVAAGGETRFHSVKNGLALVEEDGVVGVHDGVRPFISAEVIANCYAQAATLQAVVPVTDVVETVRHLLQVFTVELLKRAYAQNYKPFFTDDASVVEALGQPIHLVSGNRENIKLTTPFDLKVAESLIDD